MSAVRDVAYGMEARRVSEGRRSTSFADASGFHGRNGMNSVLLGECRELAVDLRFQIAAGLVKCHFVIDFGDAWLAFGDGTARAIQMGLRVGGLGGDFGGVQPPGVGHAARRHAVSRAG